MIIEYFIFTTYTLFIIFEYMYMMISSTQTYVYSIVPITNVYISYSEEAEFHQVFNGSRFLSRLDELDSMLVYEIYRVSMCAIV